MSRRARTAPLRKGPAAAAPLPVRAPLPTAEIVVPPPAPSASVSGAGAMLNAKVESAAHLPPAKKPEKLAKRLQDKL